MRTRLVFRKKSIKMTVRIPQQKVRNLRSFSQWLKNCKKKIRAERVFLLCERSEQYLVKTHFFIYLQPIPRFWRKKDKFLATFLPTVISSLTFRLNISFLSSKSMKRGMILKVMNLQLIPTFHFPNPFS